ncbi:MAG: response regulator transcription factor [Anaerolineae bacterium]|nr:response regulator transcription factor [Anaerolineae bacterium]
MKTILLVEDEPRMRQVVRAYLEQAGFRVIPVGDGPSALHAFRRERPDLIILDLMLPGMDGFEICRMLRRESGVPIIILTARVEEEDRVVGLELGADDYITKPFSPRELVARVRAVLRRAQGEVAPPAVIRIGDLVIDLDRREVRAGGREVHLTPTEFELLATMARHPGRVFTRLQLLEQVQGVAYEGYERTIDAHIKNLRQKIEPDPKNPQYVLTVYGVGYKLREAE